MSENDIFKYQHPFIDGLKNAPQNRTKELKKLRNWMETQPHLPNISDDYLHLFLHAAYYSHDRARRAIETYFTVRANSPSIFADRDVYSEKLQLMMRMIHMTRLPKTTPEGYKMLMYVIKDADPAQFYFVDAVKGFCMYNDCMISEDGLSSGYVVIFDMQHVKIGHLARISLPAVRTFMLYIQQAHPGRLMGVHVLNTATWIHHVLRIAAPMVGGEYVNLVKFHKGNYPEGIPKELLPMDYGGEAPTVEELGREVYELTDKYSEWLRETEYLISDESKRLKKNSWWSVFNGTAGSGNPNDLGFNQDTTSFKSLEID